MEKLLFGTAYYDEYMPYERLGKDIEMMKKAGINTVRIAESTWSTCEPQEGVFDFSHVERVMDAMEEAGIGVIIGTPTYAVPTWMIKSHPDILAVTVKGRGIYGARQIMDITHPAYRCYSERVIRELMKCTAHRKCVIGFQLDNETKYYGTAGKNVQEKFVKYLRRKFSNSLDAMNYEFGLDYWSNRINAWEDFPDVRGTINGSLGAEIAFGGDIARSLKRDNYLVLETQAQGYPDWTPYKGQLRLQAYSHIASGSNSVMYWHWHSIHNSFETYWKGVLSHDFQENDTYREACIIGREFSETGSRLVNLKKENDVAVLISNEALTALKWFGIEATAAGDNGIGYNDVVRWIYDTLYGMNVECDFLWPESENFGQYKVLIVPALYAAPDTLLERLNQYVQDGGSLLATFKTGFANENVKVSHETQPHILSRSLGIKYHQFTFPRGVKISGKIAEESGDREVKAFMELLEPDSAEVLAFYDHYNWKSYAAVTKNEYGKGKAVYVGCMTGNTVLERLLDDLLKEAGVERAGERFPVIVRKGKNDFGRTVRFYLNYSAQRQTADCGSSDSRELLSGRGLKRRETFVIEPWGVKILEEKQPEQGLT